MGDLGFGYLITDFAHSLIEQVAILRFPDRFLGRADHLDAVLLQYAVGIQIQRTVQRRLPAHGRQDRIGALLLDDLLDGLPIDRFDVDGVGHVRIGHDRRRIRVHQNDAVTFLAQRLAGLGAGIVEFAGLADDDGAGAQ